MDGTGWRARIGVLYPSAGVAELEFLKLAPEGVSLHVTRIRMRRGSKEELRKLADRVEDASRLLADAGVDLIAFNCTAGSLIGGPDYDKEIIRRIESATGITATTTTTAVIDALRALDIRKLLLVTPYYDEINAIEVDFVRALGFEVISWRGLGIDEPIKQAAVNPWQWYRMARQLYLEYASGRPGPPETPRRAVFDESRSMAGAGLGFLISCAGIRVVDVIRFVESDTGLPVVTSNQALIWHCLRSLGIEDELIDYGRLFGRGSRGGA